MTDPHDANTAYVTFAGIRYHDYIPHVFKTTDLGVSWTDISANLPDFSVNNIQIDPDIKDYYYLATDGGVFASYDGGESWAIMAPGIPNAPVLDLNIHQPSRTLLAATFGRSMWRIDLASATSINERSISVSKLKAYPNPAEDQVNIVFNLESDQEGQLMIFDISGKQVSTIFDGFLAAGEQSFVWNGKANGSRIPGMYICRLVTNKTTEAIRIQVQ
jgi:hypothetical protein